MRRLLLVCLGLGIGGTCSTYLPAARARDDKPTAGLWAYTSPKRPKLPALRNDQRAQNPIDHFIFARLAAEGLSASPQADKPTLLRRVTFDLTGLPPTVAEQEAFLADDSVIAYERVVDRLLDSPRFGERWGQHWLDLVRYAESDGFKSDDYRPSAHHYRDYVIQALNADLPYDRFVRQQLAGDELEPESAQALVATGLNRLWPDEYNAANLEQRRQEILDDIVEVTSSAFLGLTIGCARCHNHKFDPISQKDHFAFQAFFAPMYSDDGGLLANDEQLGRYRRQMTQWEQATEETRSAMKQLVGEREAQQRKYAAGKFRKEIQDAIDTPAEKRTPYQEIIARMAEPQVDRGAKDAMKKLPTEMKKKYEELDKKLQNAAVPRPPEPPRIMGVRDLGRDQIPPTHLLAGGDWRKPKAEIQPGFPEILRNAVADVPISPLPHSSGRRAALASWLTQPGHPLTARVIANRLWQNHFGSGIVGTASDFGSQGEPATHPELLDWLAVELTDHGWSMKHLHRLMVTSATYRQASVLDAARPETAMALEIDKENKLLWRANRRRLEGESVRDSVLSLAGQLNERMFGVSARPRLPEKLSTAAWKPDSREADQQRRSVYVYAKRNVRYPLFEAFDQPDLHNSCSRRSRTITAPQALLLLNSELTLSAAKQWCQDLLNRTVTPGMFAREAIRMALGREPTGREMESCLSFLSRQSEMLAEAGEGGKSPTEISRQAAFDFCHVLLNTNELLYID